MDRSGGKSELMEDTLHRHSDGMVVGVDLFWVLRAASWVERLSGDEEGRRISYSQKLSFMFTT
jgi:hypothetical protein